MANSARFRSRKNRSQSFDVSSGRSFRIPTLWLIGAATLLHLAVPGQAKAQYQPRVPITSGALEASHVLRAAPGSLYWLYASNLTGGSAGFLLVFDATSVPNDGAVVPKICVPFSGGAAQAAYGSGVPARFDVGITAVISSGANCFTQTTSTLTGFISGVVQ